MSNYATLKAAIAAAIRTNGNEEITGTVLQNTLLSIVDSIGANYTFAGVATPQTDAGAPDQNVFYIGGAGTYTNFGSSYTVPLGSIGVFAYNGSWANTYVVISNHENELERNEISATDLNGKFNTYIIESASDLYHVQYIPVAVGDKVMIIHGSTGDTAKTMFIGFFNSTPAVGKIASSFERVAGVSGEELMYIYEAVQAGYLAVGYYNEANAYISFYNADERMKAVLTNGPHRLSSIPLTIINNADFRTDTIVTNSNANYKCYYAQVTRGDVIYIDCVSTNTAKTIEFGLFPNIPAIGSKAIEKVYAASPRNVYIAMSDGYLCVGIYSTQMNLVSIKKVEGVSEPIARNISNKVEDVPVAAVRITNADFVHGYTILSSDNANYTVDYLHINAGDVVRIHVLSTLSGKNSFVGIFDSEPAVGSSAKELYTLTGTDVEKIYMANGDCWIALGIYNTSVTGIFFSYVNKVAADAIKASKQTSQDSPLKGKVISWITDSIGNWTANGYAHDANMTVNDMYWSLIMERFGAVMGVRNSTSGGPITTSPAEHEQSLWERKAQIDLTGSDYLVIEMGMNDLGYCNVPLGDFDFDTAAASQDLTKFIPTYRAIIEYFRTQYPSIRIYICTITCRAHQSSDATPAISPWKNGTTGITWPQYNEAIRKIADVEGCGLIDFAKCGIAYENYTLTTDDGVHPNKLGHLYMAERGFHDFIE